MIAWATRPRPALTLVAGVIAWFIGPSSAAAQTDQIRTYLQRANPGCTINLSPQPAPSGHVEGTDKVVTVVQYLAEGCGSGNNWASRFAVFNDDNGQLTEFEPATPMSGQVDNLALNKNVIVVRAHEYKQSDAHCCPSKAVTYRFVVRDGGLVSAR